MRPPERWPVHPAPAETESLSSWLRRIAASYGLHSYELLEHGLGHRELSDPELDLDPPTHLLEELAKRTGLDQHRVDAMTMAGWVPWLFDSLVPAPRRLRNLCAPALGAPPAQAAQYLRPAEVAAMAPGHRGAAGMPGLPGIQPDGTALLAIAGPGQLPGTRAPARNLRRASGGLHSVGNSRP